jgi:uncharacterized iron-regulated membrane protein
MQLVALIHRWAGGLIGLLLALLGLTGALLLWKGAWLRLTMPVSEEVVQINPATLGALTDNILAGSAQTPTSIVFANSEFTVHTVRTGQDSGFYADANGAAIASWDSVWDRLEIFLFDLHHRLLVGEVGETVSGIAGLVGLGFIITGLILWWSTRKTFRLRLWPARMTRPAIIRQHRDMGVVLAPLLVLTMLTGVMMTLKPVAELLLSPFSSAAEMDSALEPPKVTAGPADNADWPRIMAAAQARFPDAIIRIIGLPRKAGDPVAIRLKRPGEWHNNGRTIIWFDGATGNLLLAKDALAMPQGLQLFNLAYPLHAAKVGGIVYKVTQTIAGLALALLGSLAVWSFWFRKKAISKPIKP